MNDEDGDGLPDYIERLIEAMDPSQKIRAAIRLHLIRQRIVPLGFVRLDDDSVVKVGEDE